MTVQTNLDEPMPAEHRRIYTKILMHVRAVFPSVSTIRFYKNREMFRCSFVTQDTSVIGYAEYDQKADRAVLAEQVKDP